MKTVYAISSGSYSDYSVSAICLDRALAETLAAKMNKVKDWGDAYDVEEMRLLESEADIFRTTMYCVETDGDGREVRRWTYEHESWRDESPGSVVWDEERRARGVTERGYDVALKIARDLLAEAKAKRAGA